MTRRPLAIGPRLLTGIGLGLVLFVVLSIVSYESAQHLAQTANRVRHTHDVLERIAKLRLDVARAAGGEFPAARGKFSKDLGELRRLTADNASQQARLTALEELVGKRPGAANPATDPEVERALDRIEAEERGLLGEREALTRDHWEKTFLILPAITIVGLGLLLTVLFFLNSEVARRREAEAPRRLAAEILRSTNDAVITKTLEGIITSWNPGAEQIFGYTAEEAIGHPVLMFIPPERASEETEILRRVSRGERIEHFETERIRKDGRRAYVSVTVSPLLDAKGCISGAAKILRDITERKQAEEERRESERRLNFALETSHTGAWELSLTDRTASRTAIHDRIFGYEELLPRWTYEMFLEHVLPEDRAEVDRGFQEALTRRTTWNFECRIRRADGEIRWIWAAGGHIIDPAGAAVRIAGVVQDVTVRRRTEDALRASEGRYRALFENAPDGILIADPQSRYLDANTSICRMLGYGRGELIGMRAEDIVFPDEIEHIGVALKRIKSGPDYHREWRFRRKDGSVLYGEVIAAAMPDGNLVGIVRDIGERKQIERRLGMRNDISRVLASATSLAEAAPGILRAICEAELWEFGSIWEVDQAAWLLRRREVWRRAGFDWGETPAVTIGESLPGKAWAAAELQLGLPGSLAFPIVVGSEVTGVFEFASGEIRQPDEQLTEMFTAIGRQVGQFIARERAQEALRAGEERFRTMANSIPQLAWNARADGSIYWYNDRWYEYTGTTPEQMQGWGWKSVHDPAVLPDVVERWTAAIASGQPFSMEFPLRGVNGKFRTFLTRAHPLKDAEGRVAQWFGTNTDVDELKRMEATLRESQVRLNSALSAGSIGTWTWDIVNDRLRSDEFTARMFSIGPDDAERGVPAAEYLKGVLAADQAGVTEGLARAIESCGQYDIEYRVPQPDGLRWLQAKGRVEGDTSGRAVSFHGAVIDITGRKRAEGRFRRLVDSNAQGVIFWKTNGMITGGNDKFLEILGYTREDLESGKMAWTALTPPDQAYLDEISLAELTAKGICTPFEKEFYRKDGSRVPVLLGAALFEDNPEEGVCFLLDVSARRQQENALRESEEYFRFLNGLSDATRALADPERIMAVTTRMLGEHLRVSRCAYADVEEDGDHFTILHDYTDGCASTVGRYQLALFGEQSASTLQSGQTLIIRDVETEILPGEGLDMFHAIGFQAIVCCPLVKDGHLRALMAVHQTTARDWTPREITIVEEVVERCWATIERRNAEESLRRFNLELERRVAERTAELEAANKELEAFSYSVSHDLRAPLRAVDGFSDAVLETYGPRLPEEGRRYLHTIRRGAQRMGALIDDLLEFSRLSRQQVSKRAVDTERVVRDVLEELSSQREGRQVEIRVGSLPACQGDRALLEQVWMNLISNALKYTRKCEHALVEIGSMKNQEEDVFFVKDNGTGFDMKYASKLFGVFQRLHRTEDYEGTGVGLAIVQRVIHRHGGRIWADAAVNRGAAFYFTLR